MKDYTELFNELYAIDITGLPFDSEDAYVAKVDWNIHYQSADHNNIFVLVGTRYSLDEFIKDYKRIYNIADGRIGEPVLLKTLISKEV